MIDDSPTRLPDDADRNRIDHDGFLVVRNLLQANALSAVERWVSEISDLPVISGGHWVFHEPSRRQGGGKIVNRMERFCEFHPAMADFCRNGILAAWASDLLGGPVHLFKEKINFKMPGGAGFDLHQDQQAGWGRYAPRFVTAVLTIDPATIENGCLEIEAGRHDRGLLGPEWAPLPPGSSVLTPVPTEPGDVIFLDSFAPHASQPNHSEHPRRILFVTYNLACHGDRREDYYQDKYRSYPPDIDRDVSKNYTFRV